MKFKVIYRNDGKCYALGVLKAICIHEAANSVSTWMDIFGNKLDLTKIYIQECCDKEFDRIKALIEKQNESIVNSN